MEKEVGTCIWFAKSGQSFGYLGWGECLNGEYEKNIYVHYKNITKRNLRDPNFSELRPGDVAEFVVGPGYKNPGTQALEVEITIPNANNS